jgi:hypothetical protein
MSESRTVITWRGKKAEELTASDVDELRYQVGERLRIINERKEAIKDSGIEEVVNRNKKIKRDNAKAYDGDIRQVQAHINETDAQIDEILHLYAQYLLDDLEYYKGERKRLKAEKDQDAKHIDEINAEMLTSLRDAEGYVAENEEQIELMRQLIADIERNLARQDREREKREDDLKRLRGESSGEADQQDHEVSHEQG